MAYSKSSNNASLAYSWLSKKGYFKSMISEIKHKGSQKVRVFYICQSLMMKNLYTLGIPLGLLKTEGKSTSEALLELGNELGLTPYTRCKLSGSIGNLQLRGHLNCFFC